MTILEAANKLGVTKTAIRKHLTEEFRNKYCSTKANGAINISAEGVAAIEEKMTANTDHKPTTNRPQTDHKPTANRPQTDHKPTANRPQTDHKPTANRPQTDHKPTANTDREPTTNQVSADILEIFRKQLEEKDFQIKAQQEQISQLTAALEHTTTSLQAAQALHAGTMQQQLLLEQNEDAPEKSQEPQKAHKKHWWSKR